MTRALAPLAAVDAALLLASAWPRAAVATHVALTLATGLLWLRSPQPGVAAAIALPLGPVALLLAQILARSPRGPGIAPPLAKLAPAPRPQAVGRLLDGRVRHAHADALGSLALVLRHGDITARRSALEAVVRSFEPALSPLVAQALSDRDQTIRALAAAAAARIVQNLAVARQRWEARVAAREEGARAALAALLGDHARDNVLLSETQRAQLRADLRALLPDDALDVRRQAELAWATGDYARLDELAGDGALGGIRDWWRTEPA